jgi:hypothetical protein
MALLIAPKGDQPDLLLVRSLGRKEESMRRTAARTLLTVAPILTLLAGGPLAAQSSLELRGGVTWESPHFFVGGLDFVRHVAGPLYISAGVATSGRTADMSRGLIDTGQGQALGVRRVESQFLEIPLAVRAEFGWERLRARVAVATVPGFSVSCRSRTDLYVLDPLGRLSEERRGEESGCSDDNIDSRFTVFGRLETGAQLSVSDRIAIVTDVGYGFGEPSIEWWDMEIQGREEEWRLVAGVRYALR